MDADLERLARNRKAMAEAKLDALVCSLPTNVLLMSGYWPVIGNSIAILTDKRLVVLAPEDEKEIADDGWADEILAFQPGSLHRLSSLMELVQPRLTECLRELGLERGRIGYESGQCVQAAPYAAMNIYGGAMESLLRESAPGAHLVAARDLLGNLTLTLTSSEIARVREACLLAGRAFAEGVGHVRAGQNEASIAALFTGPLLASHDGRRAEGFVFCMSGPNAAEAYKSFQRTRNRELRPGDMVLIHCNSNVGGYWTDITRTYSLGQPNERGMRMYQAVLAARDAALKAVRPGAQAADVDEAARRVMTEHGFGEEFRHPTGHGVGFAAIDHNARPRLHPKSPDVLQEGMVFNVEPGAYFEGQYGMRHCEMVAVTADGVELLTEFQDKLEDLILS